MYKEDQLETKAIISNSELYNMINHTNRRLLILCEIDKFRMRRDTFIDNINTLSDSDLPFTNALKRNYRGVEIMNKCINRMLERLEKQTT
mgnify:CR=1 FL=1